MFNLVLFCCLFVVLLFLITHKQEFLWMYVFRCILKRYSHFTDGSNGKIEKPPFIAKPVRLTPAWEANNLPNDELNFRGISSYSTVNCSCMQSFSPSNNLLLLSCVCVEIKIHHFLKEMTMERATMEINPPRDKLNIIFFILLLHGIGTLMPWNMFINAKSVSLGFKLTQNIYSYSLSFLFSLFLLL